METLEAVIWLPYRNFFEKNNSSGATLHNLVLHNFINDFDYSIRILSPDILKVSIEKDTPSTKIKGYLSSLGVNNHFLLYNECLSYLKIKIEISYSKREIQKTNDRKIKDKDLISLVVSILPTVINDLLMLFELSNPAILKFTTGYISIGNIPYYNIEPISGFPFDLHTDYSFDWPNFNSVSLREVVDWESKLGLFRSGIGKTPISRMLASFTHAASQSSVNSGEALFWTMQGLESFYCSGSGDLRRQLSLKSQLFLGKWEESKNIVGHLYDIRSKFVHGAFNLEKWNNDFHLEDSDYKDLDKLYIYSQLAFKMLISTLQKCVKDSIYKVDFDYTLIINDGEKDI